MKMNNYTVLQLKVMAKEHGIRGYYKLRKEELIHAFQAARLVKQTSNIFDESISNNSTPVLQPTSWRPLNIAMNDKQNKQKFLTIGMQKIKDFGE